MKTKIFLLILLLYAILRIWMLELELAQLKGERRTDQSPTFPQIKEYSL